jgi:hypothetical protein
MVSLTACGQENYGRWELKNIDGKAVTDPEATGDMKEAYFTKLEALEGGKLFSMKCQTIASERNFQNNRKPEVRVYMHISDYNRNSGKIWNSKPIYVEQDMIWDYLDKEETFFWNKKYTFETVGWKNTWRKAMGHCLTAFNKYVEEWNLVKNDNQELIDVAEALK